MKKKQKKFMTHEDIYKIMQWLPIAVASIFFIINVKKGNKPAMIVIGACLAVFLLVFLTANIKKVALQKREFIISIALPILIFLISLFSGASYSDDFSLFMAVIAMTGMFLEPRYTLFQIPLIDILLVAMYIIHPEKTEGQSQFILCVACFTLAAILFYQVIKRGKAFIDISEERAKESEKLLCSIQTLGNELQSNFAISSQKIAESTEGLREGSITIARDSSEVSNSCNDVKNRIEEAHSQIASLNNEVRQFETGLVENATNVSTMHQQIDTVDSLISESGIIFRTMETQMDEIVGVAKQISDISFKLTILSLNAAVESARAGSYGVGFDVIAGEMRELSETSGRFAAKVGDVVKELQVRVSETSTKFIDSEKALTETQETMNELVTSFQTLNKQFENLYENIEYQNNSIHQIDYIFNELECKVNDMNDSSTQNQSAVDSIADAMNDYRQSIEKIIENTQSI